MLRKEHTCITPAVNKSLTTDTDALLILGATQTAQSALEVFSTGIDDGPDTPV